MHRSINRDFWQFNTSPKNRSKNISTKSLLQNLFVVKIFTLAVMLSALTANAYGPVRRSGAPIATSGLDGYTIALSNSHGRYYNLDEDQWLWQRAHLMQTIEDLYTSSYVIDLLAPMLENAGAYVMLPRERDLSPIEVIIDNDSQLTSGYKEKPNAKKFSSAEFAGFKMPNGPLGDRENPFKMGHVRQIEAINSKSNISTAEYNATIPKAGTYTIYVSYATLPNSCNAVKYTVNSLQGSEEFIVDQTMGGGTWIRLGEFPLSEGKQLAPIVSVSNHSTKNNIGKIITLDAVKIGGGMGNVARGNDSIPTVSGLPRWAEGSRYWLQWVGAPVEVYSPKEYENDYSDDFNSRPLWVNWLIGGSKRLPKQNGLNIPVDIFVAVHSDAGTTPDSTIVGTMGIYSTDGGRRLGDGRRRTTNGRLTNSIVDQIVDDVKKLHEPNWVKRKTRNRKYAEARIPEIPAALIEMLSHQNFSDMRQGLNPEFRFNVARAIYKGILKYRAAEKKIDYVVQPLPVREFSIINSGNGNYTLSWTHTVDSIEPTAIPNRYAIELRENNGVFKTLSNTSDTTFVYKAPVNTEISFRIIAFNEGGKSFPSETLSLYRTDNDNPEMLIVNAFTRLSAPDWIETDSIAGFLDQIDYGVPYIRNIAYSGSQIDFDRSSEWEDDIIHPGVGASKSDYDCKPVAGNTFDYPAQHGRSIAKAEYPYVSTSVAGFIKHHKQYNQPIIDVILGKQKEIQPGHSIENTKFKAFTPEFQHALQSHIKRGGNLLISGEFIASDIYANPFSCDSTMLADSNFAKDVLGIIHESSFASTSGNIEIKPHWTNENQAIDTQYSSKPNEQIYAAGSCDAIAPAIDAQSEILISYKENGFPAAVATRRGEQGIIALGFPFEAIFNESERDKLMLSFINYLTPKRKEIMPINSAFYKPNIDNIIPIPETNLSPTIIKN